jgi:deoxyribodipyrimidine photo-lyase
MPQREKSIVWFRNDLRLADHGALQTAVSRGGTIIPVYVWSPEEEGLWSPGAASRWWLHQSLVALDRGLRACGSRLLLREGLAAEALGSLAAECGVHCVFAGRRYDPAGRRQERSVAEELDEAGVELKLCGGAVLCEPTDLHTKSGGPYRVFTPFWRALQESVQIGKPTPAPKRLPSPSKWPRSMELDRWRLEPRIDWAGGLRESWQPGEDGAQAALKRAAKDVVPSYGNARDFPAEDGTSRLSPHLHFGEISPRAVWYALMKSADVVDSEHPLGVAEPLLRQLAWREFAHHLLFHYPETATQPLRPEFADFPYRKPSKAERHAWQQGETGYPWVDAGMRELWHTGWMHNRVRMAVASLLVKGLLHHWLEGARWFWDTLVDADLANNTLGWQWVAGCGADAAPYFRIFNPSRQGERFDKNGDYVRRWVPELASLPSKWIHRPWEAPADVLRQAGVQLGDTYPRPIVDHQASRQRALAAFEAVRT